MCATIGVCVMHIFRTSVNTKTEYDELFKEKDKNQEPLWIVKDTSGRVWCESIIHTNGIFIRS